MAPPVMENVIKVKSYAFAIRVIKLYKFLSTDKREFVLSKQVLRSETAIGALVMEAEHAQSKSDFLNKMNVALKESNETKYWLMLLKDTDYISLLEFESLQKDSDEILKLLTSIVKSTKTALGR